jgi:hypothetical protein
MKQFNITVNLEDGVTEIGVFDLAKHQACTKYIKDNHPELYAVLKESYNFDVHTYKLTKPS